MRSIDYKYTSICIWNLNTLRHFVIVHTSKRGVLYLSLIVVHNFSKTIIYSHASVSHIKDNIISLKILK